MLVADREWATFDGWAASRNVDPVDLPPDRFLNLVYYWLTRGLTADKRAEVDDALSGDDDRSAESASESREAPPSTVYRGTNRPRHTKHPGASWDAQDELAQFRQAGATLSSAAAR